MLTSHKHAALATHGWKCNTGLLLHIMLQVNYIKEITLALEGWSWAMLLSGNY